MMLDTSPKRSADIRVASSTINDQYQNLPGWHIHLLVEADDQHALARGMQGFQISAAKQLNAAIRRTTSGSHRKGTVFPDRYHAEIITSPRQARHCLSYVLSNFRKHKEDCKAPMSSWAIDWFSSAVAFPGWAEYGDEPLLWRGPETYDPLITYQSKTWLLREAGRNQARSPAARFRLQSSDSMSRAHAADIPIASDDALRLLEEFSTEQGSIIRTVTGAGGYIALFRDLKPTAITDARLIAAELATP